MRHGYRARTALALLLTILGVCAYAQRGVAQQSSEQARPNILLIISDDIGLDVSTDMYPGLVERIAAQYGPHGHAHPDAASIEGHPASTPNIAQLARAGMRFTNAWAQPFCSPTRASVITGLFAAGTKITTYQDALSQKHTTFVRRLKDEGGYSTAIFGKWHLAGLPGNPSYPGMKPKQAGFELFQGNMHAALGTFWDYDYQVQDADSPPDVWRDQKPPERSLPGIAPTTYAPVVKVADALAWIEQREAEDADKPWFAWLAFNLSHATIQRAPSQMAVPNADTLNDASLREMQACGGHFGSAETGECSGESLMRAMTSSLDTVLGKLLAAVDALDPNTYVIYLGDNGTPMYGRPNLDFIDNLYITRSGRGKGTAYASGARVPMAIRGPGIAPNSVSDEFVHAADLYSTTLELAGLEPSKTVSNSDGTGTVPLDSVSLTPILFGSTDHVRDPDQGYLLTEPVNLMTGGTRQAGARNATHKVICTDGTGDDDCEFYDLIDDPLEEYPLAKPEACSGALTPADAGWHYCRLSQVLRTRSIF
jgi:arylsulfatase A-like enzyme